MSRFWIGCAALIGAGLGSGVSLYLTTPQPVLKSELGDAIANLPRRPPIIKREPAVCDDPLAARIIGVFKQPVWRPVAGESSWLESPKTGHQLYFHGRGQVRVGPFTNGNLFGMLDRAYTFSPECQLLVDQAAVKLQARWVAAGYPIDREDDR